MLFLPDPLLQLELDVTHQQILQVMIIYTQQQKNVFLSIIYHDKHNNPQNTINFRALTSLAGEAEGHSNHQVQLLGVMRQGKGK